MFFIHLYNDFRQFFVSCFIAKIAKLKDNFFLEQTSFKKLFSLIDGDVFYIKKNINRFFANYESYFFVKEEITKLILILIKIKLQSVGLLLVCKK